MTNKKRRVILTSLVAAFVAAVFCFGMFQPAMAVDTGLETTAGAAGLSTAEADTDVATITGRVINAALGLVGVIFVVLMIYAGFLWMTAQGNVEQVKKAKTMIVQASIGTLVVFASYVLVWTLMDYIFDAVL